MKEDIIHLFSTYPQFAFLASIVINVVIAVLGVVPSVFLTAANVLFFGFWPGTLISFLGEALGAFIAFLLYRYGFKKRLESKAKEHAAIQKLLHATGREAFLGIVSLRLLPFIPSGMITFTAAIGQVSVTTFFIASSIGKAPALILEAYAAYQVTAFGWQGKLILFLVAVYLLFLLFKKKKQ